MSKIIKMFAIFVEEKRKTKIFTKSKLKAIVL